MLVSAFASHERPVEEVSPEDNVHPKLVEHQKQQDSATDRKCAQGNRGVHQADEQHHARYCNPGRHRHRRPHPPSREACEVAKVGLPGDGRDHRRPVLDESPPSAVRDERREAVPCGVVASFRREKSDDCRPWTPWNSLTTPRQNGGGQHDGEPETGGDDSRQRRDPTLLASRPARLRMRSANLGSQSMPLEKYVLRMSSTQASNASMRSSRNSDHGCDGSEWEPTSAPAAARTSDADPAIRVSLAAGGVRITTHLCAALAERDDVAPQLERSHTGLDRTRGGGPDLLTTRPATRRHAPMTGVCKLREGPPRGSVRPTPHRRR